MSRKDELASAVAKRVTGWMEENVKDAYLQGWKDCEALMLEKAEALVRVAKEGMEDYGEEGD